MTRKVPSTEQHARAISVYIEVEVDVERMARELGIPISIIKDAFGEHEEKFARWLAAATTVEEVREMYRSAPPGSEVREAALAKWLSLATTPEEARGVYRIAPSGSEVEKAAIRKLATFFPKQN